MMKRLLYFCGIVTVLVNARPQQDHNLCKKYPELPYCKLENLEFHISRVISAEPKPDPNIISKKLIEPVPSAAADPILSNIEREQAIKDSKQPIEVLAEEHRARICLACFVLSEKSFKIFVWKKKQAIKKVISLLNTPCRVKKSRNKREIDEESSSSNVEDYLTYRRQRAKILNELNELDDEQRYRSSASSSSRYNPSSSTASFGSRYPSYGHSLYGYPSYGYGSGGGANTFGIGSGLNVMGVGVSSGLGLNIG